MLKKILSFFLPHHLKGIPHVQNESFLLIEQRRRYHAIISTSLIVSIFSFLMFFIRFYLEGFSTSYTLLLLPGYALFILVQAFATKYDKKPEFFAFLSLIIAYVFIAIRIASTGGIASPVVFWYFALPLAATIMISASSGLFFMLISLSQVLMFGFATRLGLKIEYPLRSPLVDSLSIMVVLLFASVLIYYMERCRKSNETIIRDHESEIAATKKLSSLGSLVAGVAHEINNPLSIILGHSLIVKELFETKISEIDLKVIEQNNLIIYKNSKRIDDIVKAFKNISTEEKTKEFQNLDLAMVITKAWSELPPEESEDIEFISTLEQTPLLGNPQLLEQVFINLFKNASYAIKEEDKKWIRVEKKSHDPLQIAITDSGPGIPADVREQIFDTFYTTKPVGSGSGIGLSLSERIIRQHGGTLKLNDKSEHTQFLITFHTSSKS